jgi:PAS domain S-box-containing protein
VTEFSRYVFSALREGDVTLYRGAGNGLSPILLAAAEDGSPGSLKRLQHEYALKAELDAAWAPRPVALSRYNDRLTLVLEDPGGEPLDRLLDGRLDVAEFMHIAIPLLRALRRVHERGLIHKDIKPANVLVDTASGVAWLTGFGIASRLPREHQVPETPEMIAGTLAYMAPEQTGRMNRSIDSRSDLYALGVTFYEMLTGTLPFMASDPMGWVHCHIARLPLSPSERVIAVPEQLSAIVMKLLAKTPEDRYQTAAGVEADLRRCLAEWESHGRVDAFPLSAHDLSERLLIPERLYGREREVATLLASFDRVVATGTPELVLVSGYSGIGKSSVVHELHKALVPPRGLFASGKFDQYKRNIPYATLAQAFQSLIRSLLAQSDAELSRWRDALREALRDNGQLIVNLVPELELVVGKQRPVPDLPPPDAQHRFHMVFRRFLGVFAREEHPLALFLDDLQWLDTATLDLLEYLVTDAEVRHLLLVGAYRDNEVGPGHPLLRTLETIRAANARMHEIVLAPLGLHDTGRLIADTLRCAPDRARPLAELVHEKTGGNPFFAIQFLTALADEGLLAFDSVALAWQWDIEHIRAKNYTDNVVELMAAKLKRFSTTTQKALKQLACLGNVVEIDTLTLVLGETEEAIDVALREAVHAGLVFQHENAYKFLHDRIQQAAYSLIPEEHRADIHLRIGRALLASMTADQLDEHLFEVANQLNLGSGRLIDRDEKAQVATIDLRAGRKAKASAASASARVYFAAGMALLDETDWVSHHELTFRLWLERAESEFLTGNLEKAEQLIGELLQRAASNVEYADACCLKVELHDVKGEQPQGVESVLTCLRLFGVDIPAHPTWEQVQAEYETIWRNLEGRPIESLIELPLMSDPELHAAMQVLSVLTSPACFTDFHLFCLHVCRMANVSIQHGVCGASAHGFAYLGTILGPVFHRYAEGYRFAKLACDVVAKHGFITYQAKVHYAMGTVAFWTQPIATAIDFMRATSRTAIETGDLSFACYGMFQSVTGLLLRNDPLDAVWRESEMALDFAREAKYGDTVDIIRSQQCFIATMQGRTATFSTFSDAQFDEATFEAQLSADRMPLTICWYWILKLKARFLSGDYADALAAADNVKPLFSAAAAHSQLLDYFLYTALTVAALYENASAEEQNRCRELLTAHREQLREWAENYPPAFADKHALVSAEIARLEGRDVDAMRLYELAVQSACENGFVQNEGLAQEVAAQFYAARGFETIARAYRKNARSAYLRWGALGKVRQLDQRYPELGEESAASALTATIDTSVEQLDIGTVVKASQALSGEIELDKLVETLMRIAIEHAGAERGMLILFRSDEPRIEAEATTGRGCVEVTLRRAAVTPSELPESVLHYAIRTRDTVILDDAAAQNPFSADEYISQKHARSVLCLPLVKQAKLLGMLYLENNLASHVFTPARISVLKLLSSQAAISIENARLYGELIDENRDRQKAEDALRASEERWRNLFENVPVGVALVGSHGRFVAANPAFQSMTGYAEAELYSRSPADITHEDDHATEAINAALAVVGPYPRAVERRYRRKDGGVTWAEVSAIVVPVAGSTPLFAAVAVDITDRKRAEDDLRRSEASLTEAQQISHTGSWRWKVGTGAVSWSAEHFRIFAFDPATTQPSFATFMERVHAEDRPSFEQALDRAVRERSRFQHEFRLALRDGSVKHVQSVGLPDITESGDLEFVGTVMDITERRRADEALRSAQAELARVARLTTMGEMVASIAHEINQPLTAIVTNAQASLRWLNRDTPDLDETRGMVESIIKNGKRAGDVIRGIRALAMKSGPHLTEFDINGAIQETLALTRSDLQRHGVVLHTELSAEVHPVFGDRVQLQQVLLNLLTNAIEAMNAVTDRPKVLAITSERVEPGGVLVAVQDTGTGLDPTNADRIFDSFFTTKPSGMGMGLSICRSIIDAHRGRLWMSPRVPHGTAVRFTVPTAPQVAQSSDHIR